MSSIAIVYQGAGQYNSALSKKYSGLPIIFSTWESNETQVEIGDYEKSHYLIETRKPLIRGPSNLNLQKISTVRGLEKASSLGFTFALKIRDDMDLDPLQDVLSLLKTLVEDRPETRFWFLDWVLHLSGYPMDFIQFGRTNDLLSLWGGCWLKRLVSD